MAIGDGLLLITSFSMQFLKKKMLLYLCTLTNIHFEYDIYKKNKIKKPLQSIIHINKIK